MSGDVLDEFLTEEERNRKRQGIRESLLAIGFIESTVMGGYALRLPLEWVEGVTVLYELETPALVVHTPGGSVYTTVDTRAQVDDDAAGRLKAAPTPSYEQCDSCDRWHRKGEEHCPNCGQPAESLFHAGFNLENCPFWLLGRWVMREDFTDADRAELARQREGATS